MFTPKLKAYTLVVVLGCCHVLWAQSFETQQYKTEVDSLAEQLAKVHIGQVVMSKRADSLAQAITHLKARPASPLNERALNTAYRTSQTMAETLQKTQAEEQLLDQLLRQKAERLLKNLNEELAHLAEASGQAKKQNEKKRYAEIKQELQICRQWQKQCQAILTSPPTTILIYEVRVAPEDDASTLVRKADFLRDQSDRLERESKRLNQKLAELREETLLRNRMTEFAQEVAMLEPSHENVRGDNAAGVAAEDFTATGPGRINDLSGASSAAFSSSELIISLSWPDQVSALSLQDLSDWQKRLQLAQNRLRAQADSLRQRAQEIDSLRHTQHE